MAQRKSCLFLDRDGVINVDRGYVSRLEDWEFIPGIFELARAAVCELQWHIVVVTNQSGIGRGYYDEETFEWLSRWMKAQFKAQGAALTDVLSCPYHPEAGVGDYRSEHPWRKPGPGMILEAQRRHCIDLGRSALIGDSESDIAAGRAAQIGLLIKIGAPGPEAGLAKAQPLYAADLAQARTILLAWAGDRRHCWDSNGLAH
jgi:D-glycero-D-manno-heptose 1,7-bisphosphate phosphatase